MKNFKSKVRLGESPLRRSQESPFGVEGRVSSQVKIEVYSEDGTLEYETPWYPNLLTNRFLDAFGEKTFANVNDLRRYLVIGVSDSPKPEIKRSSGSITGTYSLQGSDHVFTSNADFFAPEMVGWELIIPSTGAYARITEVTGPTRVKLDKALPNTTNLAFAVWNVDADLPATDRLAVTDATEGTPQNPVYLYNSTLGAYEFQNEILRVYTVPEGGPIRFSSFAFVPGNTYNPGDPTNAMVYELVRDVGGNPTVITLAPGKKIKIRHLLRAVAFLQNNLQVEVRQYDLANQLTGTSYLDAVNTLSTASSPPTPDHIRSIYERLLSPASDLFNGDTNATLEVVPLDQQGNPIVSLKKTFTSTNLNPYSPGSYRRSREVFLGEQDFVTTFYGVRTTFLKEGQPEFTLNTAFSSNSFLTKDDLHEMKVHLSVRWYRYYSA